MGTPRTHAPGEWIKVVQAAGFDYHVGGSYVIVLVGQFPDLLPAPDANEIEFPRSGRVSISALAYEIEKAKVFRDAKKAS